MGISMALPQKPIQTSQLDPELSALLNTVARSFSLSLKILPKAMRAPVSLAYLLARAADTIADTRLVARDDRLDQLNALRAQFVDTANPPALDEKTWERLTREGTLAIPEERALLARLPDILHVYHAMPRHLKRLIGDCLLCLTGGMQDDLVRFPDEAGPVRALKNDDELERYCYAVAGVVGPFWTNMMFFAHPRLAKSCDLDTMKAWGETFGKGLQLINVLKDISKDYQIGRVYLPEDQLSLLGLSPRDLGDRTALYRLSPLIDRLIARAALYLESGERYLFAIPRRYYRYRLAVIWPLWIGLETLLFIARDRALLDPSQSHKISRDVVRRVILRSITAAPSNQSLARWFTWYRRELKHVLSLRKHLNEEPE